MAEMPERIWAELAGRYRQMPTWDKDGAEYVLATTHQRTLEALREAEKAVAEVWRLSLVIESAVRNADPGKRPEVLAALEQSKEIGRAHV